MATLMDLMDLIDLCQHQIPDTDNNIDVINAQANPSQNGPYANKIPSQDGTEDMIHDIVDQESNAESNTVTDSVPLSLNSRACVTCRKRKVRCDKQMPCSNCRRGMVACVFPALGRMPRRNRPKDWNQRETELLKRLKRLESVIEELSDHVEVESVLKSSSTTSSADIRNDVPSTTQSQINPDLVTQILTPNPKGRHVSTDLSSQAEDLRSQLGRLVLRDSKGRSRYISSTFWSKLNDQLDSFREDVHKIAEDDLEDFENKSPDSHISENYTHDHHGFILGYCSADVNFQLLHPAPYQVPFLWSIYQDNIEPIIKILHVPSVDIVMREARKESSKLSQSQEALVFAIYYCAVYSLDPEETEEHLGADKKELLSRYRFALEQALSLARFLETTDFVILQALALFLNVAPQDNERRLCWALSGVFIRLATSMGIHRDGTHLGLNPFDTEMRRRLWWSIVTLDLRASFEVCMDLMIADHPFDTELPSNINDVDISPKTTKPPKPYNGRSDMSIALVRYELYDVLRRFISATSAQRLVTPKNAWNQEMAEPERTLIDVYNRAVKSHLQKTTDETNSDPLLLVAIMISRIMVAKLRLVIYQPVLFPGSENEPPQETRDRLFVASIDIAEINHLIDENPQLKPFRWHFKMFTQWHVIAHLLVEICRRPWSPLVERAWEVACVYSRRPLEAISNHEAIFSPVQKLFQNAYRHRVSEIARLQANPKEARDLELKEDLNSPFNGLEPIPSVEKTMRDAMHKWLMVIDSEKTDTDSFSASTEAPTNPGEPMENVEISRPSHQILLSQHHQKKAPITNAEILVAGNMNPAPGQIPRVTDTMAGLWDPVAKKAAENKASDQIVQAPQILAYAAENGGVVLEKTTLGEEAQASVDWNVHSSLWSFPFMGMDVRFHGCPSDVGSGILKGDLDWQNRR